MPHNDSSSNLVSRLYNTIIKTAVYTHGVLNSGTSAEELAFNDPSFPAIAVLCKSLIFDIREHKEEHNDFHSELSAGEELLSVLKSIVDAIDASDNKALNDCTYHLEEYLELNVAY